MGIGAIDTTSPLSLQMLGMHGMASANYAVEDCDLLIAVGARFDDRVATDPDNFAPKARKIAHLDVDASEVGKVRIADWYHVGLLSRDLDMLTNWGERHKVRTDTSEWLAELAESKTPLRAELRPRQRADPAELRGRGNQQARQAVRPLFPPVSASTRCGLRSTWISASRGCG